jgi:hypothetical protein
LRRPSPACILPSRCGIKPPDHRPNHRKEDIVLRRSFLAGSAAAGLSATTASTQPPVAALQDAASKIQPILAKTPL